ncbi:MAG TPA: small ribosomal subunit biogenesis GTPase RsgA, partial [Candidatus Acidoferrum sp.]|nr:small ribosomal subunit biogenesis GTPase RsgA [Candidatus Acidoferrum sp.]
MKKKGLNDRQLERIQSIQDAKAARAARKQARAEAALETTALGAEQRGLVISHYGQQLDIEALDGELTGQVRRCFQRSNLDPLVTGDEVIWQNGEPLGVVVAGQPRRSVLLRPNPFNELKPVAANIDYIVVVIAPQPEPHYNLIDRYLVAAELMHCRPVLLLNKADLLTDANRAPLDALLQLYAGLGYTTLQVSGKQHLGLEQLQQLLIGNNSVFVGQSGVGKSALVNALLPGINTLEGELSHAEVKGRHTTTSARLFHLPQGGNLIDSPGIREFGLWHIEPDQLLEGFVEFRPYLSGCRFRDCKHQKEPGCQLLKAVADGLISAQRLASFQSIRSTLA